MKRTIILTAIMFFSISTLHQLEAKPRVKHLHSCSQARVIHKSRIVTGYWKWSPIVRQYVWIKTAKSRKIRVKKRINWQF